MNHLLDALIIEIEQRSQEAQNYNIQSIYFGGGTPSILSSFHFKLLFGSLLANYNILKDCEISIECNPDDINVELLETLKSHEINRISIGIQSFNQEDLDWMNRNHTAEQSKIAIEAVINAGFDNYSIDLMYGLPNSNKEKWANNLEFINRYACPHFSAYALSIEERTALIHLYRNKLLHPADDISSLEQMNILLDFCDSSGYEAYEISNFSKPDFRSRHNSAYWNGIPYLGFGPSAHSFTSNIRKWNIANNNLYIKCIQEKIPYYESEVLSIKDQYNEYIMLNLRKKEGISLDILTQLYPQFVEDFNQHLNALLRNNDVALTNNCVSLTRSGKAQADRISSELFQLSEKS